MPGLADYAATKSGIERYTMGVARDLGPRGITATWWKRDWWRAGWKRPTPRPSRHCSARCRCSAWGHPQEIAAAIAFLTSPAAPYVTGAVLAAHGGYNV